MRAGNENRLRVAGPFTTAPEVRKREPWHGQSRVAPDEAGRLTVQPSCVHTREIATTSVGDTRVTASGVCSPPTRLAKALTVSPTPMSGTRISPVIGGGVDGVEGELGEEPPPPQPANVPATVAPVVTTKKRRVLFTARSRSGKRHRPRRGSRSTSPLRRRSTGNRPAGGRRACSPP